MANQMSKLAVGLGVLATSSAAVAADKPNILAIFGDDVGYWNISAYNQGMMGYETPNIDRIANEGALFTDHYGQQSCTAGTCSIHHRSRTVPYWLAYNWYARLNSRHP